MRRVPPDMMKPAGWFQIGWSTDFPPGHIAAKHYFGEEVVVFRADDGTLRALDAYCGHMGAHLGHGGEVCGDRVVCPFHGWEWNGDGRNVSIPYQDRPNRAVRIRSWPVMEQQRDRLPLAPPRRGRAVVDSARRLRRARRRTSRAPTTTPRTPTDSSDSAPSRSTRSSCSTTRPTPRTSRPCTRRRRSPWSSAASPKGTSSG